MTISDLCDKDRYFMSFDDFQIKYNMRPASYPTLNEIMAAVPIRNENPAKTKNVY